MPELLEVYLDGAPVGRLTRTGTGALLFDDAEFAQIVTGLITEQATWGMRENAQMRWSLPGAQPKVALFRRDDGKWAVPQDSTPTTHIIKPAIPRTRTTTSTNS